MRNVYHMHNINDADTSTLFSSKTGNAVYGRMEYLNCCLIDKSSNYGSIAHLKCFSKQFKSRAICFLSLYKSVTYFTQHTAVMIIYRLQT